MIGSDEDLMRDVYMTSSQREAYERLRKDAARYRWLRIKCGLVPSAFGIGQVAMTLAGSTDEHDAKRIDAHIDAAMNGANTALIRVADSGSDKNEGADSATSA